MNKKTLALAASLACLSLPGIAAAHPGQDAGGSFAAGLVHPLAGFDHLCALIAVGLLAARMGGRAAMIIVPGFLASMSLGIFTGLNGIELPWVEGVVGASILAVGLLAWRPPRRLPGGTAALAGSFAVFHGHAHGAEAAAGTAQLSHAAGLLLASAGVMVAGMLLAHAPVWGRMRPHHGHG